MEGGKKPTWEEKVKNKHQTLKHEELLLHLQNAKDWKLSNILVKMVNVHACACMRAWVCVCVSQRQQIKSNCPHLLSGAHVGRYWRAKCRFVICRFLLVFMYSFFAVKVSRVCERKRVRNTSKRENQSS